MVSRTKTPKDVKVLGQDAVFPHDVAALVVLTPAGRDWLIEKLRALKVGKEFVVNPGAGYARRLAIQLKERVEE